jgi:glc operon protein GlcG
MKFRTVFAGSVLSAISFVVAAQTMKPTLNLDTARRAAVGCEEKAQREGWSMTIAVTDLAGNIKYFSRADAAIGISVGLAQAKAATSASLPLSTRKLREVAANQAKGLELTPGISLVAGGLPLVMRGQHLGGIGVSGGTEDQDELCAQAGLDAVAALLK